MYISLHLSFEDKAIIWLAKLFKRQEPITEIELIQRALKNPKYFAKIYDLYHHKIFSYIYRRVGCMDTSADLTSDTFVKAFCNLHKYKPMGFGFSSWLYKIATNELNQHFRRNQTETRHISMYVKTLDVLTEMEEQCTLDEKLQVLQKALSSIEHIELQMLEWRFYEDLSFKEIGYLLDITEDNAKVRTYRVIEKIRKKLFKPRKR